MRKFNVSYWYFFLKLYILWFTNKTKHHSINIVICQQKSRQNIGGMEIDGINNEKVKQNAPHYEIDNYPCQLEKRLKYGCRSCTCYELLWAGNLEEVQTSFVKLDHLLKIMDEKGSIHLINLWLMLYQDCSWHHLHFPSIFIANEKCDPSRRKGIFFHTHNAFDLSWNEALKIVKLIVRLPLHLVRIYICGPR